MKKGKCLICETPHETIRDEKHPTDLCNKCAIDRFFLDDEREAYYRKETNERIAILEEIFGEDYNDKLHRGMVEQMVRCEIAMLRYERLIANDNEAPQTCELLKSERNHWNKVAEKLNMTLKAIRGDTKKVELEFGDDFKKYLEQVLGAMDDEEEEGSASE